MYKENLSRSFNKTDYNSIVFNDTIEKAPVVCFSHLRWNFVYQRPQHLFTNAVLKGRQVYYIEEPLYESANNNSYTQISCVNNITVITPVLPRKRQNLCNDGLLASLLSFQLECLFVRDYILWFYTPMALEQAKELKPILTVYDCMDELSLFRGAPPNIINFEDELLKKADIVFTGGRSLYLSKKNRNPDVYLFPNSIDVKHFAPLKRHIFDPQDQADIPHPRIGYYGVIDERLDVQLLNDIAALKPDWHFIVIGPVVKIDEASLPKKSNIHFLGPKSYSDLPAYLHGWDIAMMPFAKNDSAKFISPAKVLEYLAAFKPVISTSITDIEQQYGANEIVKIADSPEDFINAVSALLDKPPGTDWKRKVKEIINKTSWQKTWNEMNAIIKKMLADKIKVNNVFKKRKEYV